jgi:hypothetical protein
MPNAWIPLELEIAELTAEGKQILSLKDIEELNNASEVSTLSSKDLKTLIFSNCSYLLHVVLFLCSE